MSWLARRLVVRALAREWGRTLLTLVAVALGVAVFLSIRLANRAAVASFEQFTRGVGQGSDLIVQAEAGPLQESILPGLRPLAEWGWMRPVIEGSFARAGTLEGFQLMGLDLVGLGATAGEDSAAPQEADHLTSHDRGFLRPAPGSGGSPGPLGPGGGGPRSRSVPGGFHPGAPGPLARGRPPA